MDTVTQKLWNLVLLLEKANQARLANRLDVMDYALITMRRLLCRRYPPPLHTQN